MPSVTPEDAALFVERDMDAPETPAFPGEAGGRVAVLSRRAPEKEGPNQDAAAVIPYDAASGVLIVADGAGGQRGGAQASSIALHEVMESLEHGAHEGQSLRGAILDGIEAANREISTLGIGAATTIVVAEIRRNVLRPYHVGDSGILAVGQRGRLKLQTMFHSPTGYAVESGLLDEREAMQHDDRHLVSNVLGSPEMRIEMGAAIELSAKDTVLLASDGLFDNLQTREIVEVLRKGPLIEALTELSTRARARMEKPRDGRPSKPDDLTMVAFRLEETA